MTTQTFGDRDTAMMLYTHFNGESDSNRRSPNGFRRIGTGAYRTAILDKSSNIVYKIGDSGENLSEARNSRRLIRKSTRNLGFNVRIPRTRTFTVPSAMCANSFYEGTDRVIAQEYAVGALYAYCSNYNYWMGWGRAPELTTCGCIGVCRGEALSKLVDWSGLGDIHYGNVLVDMDNTFWIIDMAQ